MSNLEIKKLEKKLNQVERIIAKIEGNYFGKKSKSFIVLIWNNFYDLEKKIAEEIKSLQRRGSYTTNRCTRELIGLNID